MDIGIWQVNDSGPSRLNNAVIQLEKNLEDWIDSDPTLLRSDLVIVGRQVYFEAGPADLLAIDSQGRWIIIEIKKGQVDRKTLAQAIDYASCLETMPEEDLKAKTNSYLKSTNTTIEELLSQRGAEESLTPENRDIELMLVGSGKMSGLDRMTSFLSKFEIPISIVSFNTFQDENNKMFLVRELCYIGAVLYRCRSHVSS